MREVVHEEFLYFVDDGFGCFADDARILEARSTTFGNFDSVWKGVFAIHAYQAVGGAAEK